MMSILHYNSAIIGENKHLYGANRIMLYNLSAVQQLIEKYKRFPESRKVKGLSAIARL